MASQLNTHLIWVPGHRDFEGNCTADELAREGTTVQTLYARERIGMPLATCKLNIRNTFKAIAEQRWTSSSTASHTRAIWPRWATKDSELTIRLKRPTISCIVGVITGHCLIGTHAKRLLGTANEICVDCLEEEEEDSVEHLLCRYPAHANKRWILLGKPFFTDLTEISTVDKKVLFVFIKTIERFYSRG